MTLCLIGPEKEYVAGEIQKSSARIIIVRGESELDNFCTSFKRFFGWKIIFISDDKYSRLNRIGTVLFCNNSDSDSCFDYWSRNYDYEITKIDGILILRAYNALSISYCNSFTHILKIIKLTTAGEIKDKYNFKLENKINTVY